MNQVALTTQEIFDLMTAVESFKRDLELARKKSTNPEVYTDPKIYEDLYDKLKASL